MRTALKALALLLVYLAVEQVLVQVLDSQSWLAAALIAGLVTFVLVTIWSALRHEPKLRRGPRK